MLESFLIWLMTAGIALVIFLPYFLRHSREQKINIAKRLEAEDLGIIKAQAQFPQIDAALCIGCGACVDACPEKDVLRVVWGKAQIVNGLRCVGHGHCEHACPVKAIVVGLGDIKSRPDIPILNETGETSVPGLFIAGELGGLSLIKNAINQGREAANEVVRQHQVEKANFDKDIFDAVVVGAGPAGLSGALRLAEAGINYLIIDRQEAGGTILQYPRRKLVMTTPAVIPGYGSLKKAEYTKEELLEIWQDIIREKQICVQHGHSLKTIQQLDSFFEIVTSESTIKARKVILALGRRGTPRKLNIPGEKSAKVSYQLVDAQSYTNSRVLIVGGGDSAVEAAIGLAKQTGNTVHISYRKKQFFRIKRLNQERIEKLIGQGRIQPIWESNLKLIENDSTVITTPNGDINLPNDYVFIFAGGVAPFNMLKEMGIRFGGDQVKIDER